MALVLTRVVVSIPPARKHMVRHGIVPSLMEAIGNLLAATFFRDPTKLLMVLAAVVFIDPVWHAIGYNFFRLLKRERVPIHVDHMIERRGCLRLILFGEVVTGCTITPKGPLTLAAIAPVALAFLVVLNMKLLAFDVDIVPIKRHCFRTGGYARPLLYLEAAWCFDVSMVIMGSCVKIVLTIMLADASERSSWVRADQAHLLLCLCVAVGFFCLTAERLTHDQSHILGNRSLLSVLLPCFRRKTPDAKIYGAIVPGRQQDPVGDGGDSLCIFLLQLATHGLIIVLCIALAAYCNHIDEEYEHTLVLACLATMTSAAVVINLIDEVTNVTNSQRGSDSSQPMITD